jgi:dUTP pyrophosphatase
MPHPDSVPVLTVGKTPQVAKPGDAGADLVAAGAVTLAPGQRAVVPTGLRIALPAGFMALVLPRSGLAAKHGVTLVNSPGLIDAGYRGEISVVLLNTDKESDVTLEAGDRIAQLVVLPVTAWHSVAVSNLPGSDRGEGGFGSTGVK